MTDVKIRVYGEDEVSAILKHIDERLDGITETTQESVQKQKGSFDMLKGTYTDVRNIIQDVYRVAQQAYQFLSEGAAVKQTKDSFDLLLNSIGANSDALDELKDAAGGTIPELELISSTSTLLAGVSDEVARALIENADDLLLIARAANKLNPTLGTTTDLYQALATGIKRNSPLLIDNTGLTVKVGEANDAYAKQLGKTTEELTAEERQMALLNATLKAGDTLIEQVGGSVDSATDSFSKLDAAWSNIVAREKEGFAEALLPSVEAIADNIDQMDQWNKIQESGAISQERMAEIARQMQGHYITEAEALAMLTDEMEQYQSEISILESFQGQFDGQLIKTEESIRQQAEVFDYSAQQAQFAAKANQQAANAMSNAGGEADIASTWVSDLAGSYSSLSTNIDSATTSLQNQIDFIAAGGAAVNVLMQEAQNALDAGDIGLAQKIADEASLAAADVQLELGQITAEEAAQKISDDLGVSFEEAEQMVDTLEQSLFNMTARDYFVNVGVNFSGSYTPGASTGAGGGGQTGGGLDIEGTYASGTGGWSTVPETGLYQLHKGEPFNVMPVGSQPGGGGDTYISVNIENVNDGSDLLAVIDDMQRNASRNNDSWNAGAGYN